MRGERLDLGEGFQDEAGMKVIDEVALAVDRVIPGSVGVLTLQHEIQVSLCGVGVPGVGKIHACRHEERCPVRARVDDASRIVRVGRVGAARGARRGFDVPIVQQRVLGGRLHQPPPSLVLVDLIDLAERLVRVRRRRDERRVRLHRAVSGLPVEGIPPCVTLVAGRTRLLEHLEEMHGAPMVSGLVECPGKEREAHRVMRVRDGESLRLPEEAAR